MNKILYIISAILLFQSCSIFSKKVNNDVIINEPVEDHNFSNNDSLIYVESASDSLSSHLIDSSLIKSTVFTPDIFDLIPVQKVMYGDTLRINLQNYIYSNYLDINLNDSKSFNVRASNDSLFIAPLINKNQISSIQLDVNNRAIDIMVFSFSRDYSDGIYKKDKKAVILKDSHTNNPDNLILNYKYFPLLSFDTNLKDNSNYILFNNLILEPKYYHIFSDGIRIMLPKPIDNATIRILSVDKHGALLQENNTIISNNLILSPDSDQLSPYFSNMYYAFTDRFYDEKSDSSVFKDLSVDRKVNFHGGDFLGLSKKINNGYFNKLGVTNLIISPVIKNYNDASRSDDPPYRKHMGFDGLWPIDSRSVDPRLGTDSELKDLISNSHNHGLGIYLDYVIGHTHVAHMYYNLYPHWFIADFFQNRNFLPQLDFSNNEVVRQVSSDIVYWLNQFNFNGMYYNSTENTSGAFWSHLNRSIYSEINRENQLAHRDSRQFNLSLYYKARDHFSGLNTDFRDLNSFIKINLQNVGSINYLGTLTTMHSDPKFISVADGHVDYQGADDHRIFVDFPEKVMDVSSYEKLFMFYLMNNSLPGIPILFQGDEYGQVGIGFSDSKRDIKFPGELNSLELKLKDRISRLNLIRAQYPSLSMGDFFVLKESLDFSVWLKSYFDEHTVIFFNLQNKAITLNVALPFEARRLISLLDDKIIELDDPKMASIVIPPYKSGILLLDPK